MQQGSRHSISAKTKMIRNRKSITKFWLGKKMSQETRAKMSKSQLKRKERFGYMNSPETRKKLSIANTGHRASEESKLKNSKWHLGKQSSDATKRKKSIAQLKRQSLLPHKTKKQQRKEYVQKNYEKVLMYNRNRRVSKFNNGGVHTCDDWDNLKAQYNWTCPRCGKSEPEIKLTEDHIIPLSKGGSNNIENIQPLCKSCNCWKHTKTIKFNKINKN